MIMIMMTMIMMTMFQIENDQSMSHLPIMPVMKMKSYDKFGNSVYFRGAINLEHTQCLLPHSVY